MKIKYHYSIRGHHFVIYQTTETPGEFTPKPDEPEYSSREEARRRVYELNGWTYTSTLS